VVSAYRRNENESKERKEKKKEEGKRMKVNK
jgi:hypothetical protein